MQFFTASDDLDLIVITPNGDSISWRNGRDFVDPETGGRLDLDNIPTFETAPGRFVENIIFPDGPAGEYTFYVNNYNQIESVDGGFTLSAWDGDERLAFIRGDPLGNDEDSDRNVLVFTPAR